MTRKDPMHGARAGGSRRLGHGALLVALLALTAGAAQAATEKYRLTWRADPATTMVVGWNQLSGTDERVCYGTDPDGSASWTCQDPDREVDYRGMQNRFVRLTGLSPDTAYHFEVRDSEGASEPMWFRTAPDSAEPFTFIAGGDTRTNEEPRRWGQELVAKIRPLFVLQTGDFMDVGDDQEWDQWLDEWQLTRSEDGRVYPLIPVHGNHENDDRAMVHNIFDTPLSPSGEPDAYFALSIAGDLLRLYTLNSELEPDVGYGQFSGQDATRWNQQAAWLEAELAANAASHIWNIVTYHRPMRPHTSGKTEGLGRIAAWADAMYDYGVDLAIECDTHNAKHTFPVRPTHGLSGNGDAVSGAQDQGMGSFESFTRDDANGIVFTGEGSWGAPNRPDDDDKPWTMDSESFWQYKVVQVGVSRMDIRTVRFGSEDALDAGIAYDPATVAPLTAAERQADPFALPAGLDLWSPLSGEVLTLPFSGTDSGTDRTELVKSGSTWSYLDDGSDPGTAWREAGYDDSAWPLGSAQLGYGDGDEMTPIGYGDDANDKHITYYFRQTFSLADAGSVLQLKAWLKRDDGAVLYLNGQEVARSNMPGGPVGADTPALNGVGGSAEDAWNRLALPTDALQDGQNVIAVEVHQVGATSSDVSFDLVLAAVTGAAGSAPAAPDGLTATALSTEEVEVTWNDNAADEVHYQMERLGPEGYWEIVAPELPADTTVYSERGLDSETAYTYRVRALASTGVSAPSGEATATTPADLVPVILEEDFETPNSLGRFTAVDVKEPAKGWSWVVWDFGSTGAVQGNNFGDGAGPTEDWLITTSPINFHFYRDESLEYDAQISFSGPAPQVLYSTDYDPAVDTDPNTATWNLINEDTSDFDELTRVGPFDLSGVEDTAYVAFRYTGDGSGGGESVRATFDDVRIQGSCGYDFQGPENDPIEFDGNSPWTVVNRSSELGWIYDKRAERQGAINNNFGSGEGGATGGLAADDWLISPPLFVEGPLSGVSFAYYEKYGDTLAAPLQVLVTGNYTGDPATTQWTDITPMGLDGSTDDAWINVRTAPFSVSGDAVRIAFRYRSAGNGAGTTKRIGVDEVCVSAQGGPLEADFALARDGAEVTFVPDVSGGVPPYDLTWDFGDGNTSTENKPTHTYTAAGTYTVSVTVTDQDGAQVLVTYPEPVEVTRFPVPDKAGDLRISTFNASMNRPNAGDLAAALAAGDDPQIRDVAEVIQRADADVVLINEFDQVYDGSGDFDAAAMEQAIADFKRNYLEVAQAGDTGPVSYPYHFVAPSNTGVPSGYDLNNDGTVGGPGDAFGFGEFPGQYGMVLLSKHPVLEGSVRTFQEFLWKDMPGALLPPDPNDSDGNGDTGSYYTAPELDVVRLSSKSHWDVPVEVDGEVVHLLASHPTPPVFDDGTADEPYPDPDVVDWNGLRNHDEIRFWADYVAAAMGGYIYDDQGTEGGLPEGARFVILGDQNADPVDGDSTYNPILMLLDSPAVDTSVTPASEGALEQVPAGLGERATKTASFNLRADYALPSLAGWEYLQGWVFWPVGTDAEAGLLSASDHRMVVVDLGLEPVAEVLLGDANGDGTLDRGDLFAMRPFLRRSADACPACDLNGDGRISIHDARLLALELR